MLKPISTLSVLALVGLALFIAGCGGDDGDATANDAPLTKAEFIKKAEDICGKADTREANGAQIYIVKNKQALKGLPVFEVSEKIILNFVVPSIRKEVQEIKALGIPEGDEAELEKYFEAVEAGAKQTEKAPLDAEKALPENSFWEPFKLGKAYGFKECARIY